MPLMKPVVQLLFNLGGETPTGALSASNALYKPSIGSISDNNAIISGNFPFYEVA